MLGCPRAWELCKDYSIGVEQLRTYIANNKPVVNSVRGVEKVALTVPSVTRIIYSWIVFSELGLQVVDVLL